MLGKYDKNAIPTSTLKHKFLDIVFTGLGFAVHEILVISFLNPKRRMLSTSTVKKRSSRGN